jgi:hypothetical protein
METLIVIFAIVWCSLMTVITMLVLLANMVLLTPLDRAIGLHYPYKRAWVKATYLSVFLSLLIWLFVR